MTIKIPEKIYSDNKGHSLPTSQKATHYNFPIHDGLKKQHVFTPSHTHVSHRSDVSAISPIEQGAKSTQNAFVFLILRCRNYGMCPPIQY
jgi:hypothetical protein